MHWCCSRSTDRLLHQKKFANRVLLLLCDTAPTVFSLASKKLLQAIISWAQTGRSSSKDICHQIDSWRAQDDGVQARHGRKEFPYMLYSVARSYVVCSQDKKTTYFKLIPNMEKKLKVAIWVSGTHIQCLLHVHTAMHTWKLHLLQSE